MLTWLKGGSGEWGGLRLVTAHNRGLWRGIITVRGARHITATAETAVTLQKRRNQLKSLKLFRLQNCVYVSNQRDQTGQAESAIRTTEPLYVKRKVAYLDRVSIHYLCFSDDLWVRNVKDKTISSGGSKQHHEKCQTAAQCWAALQLLPYIHTFHS